MNKKAQQTNKRTVAVWTSSVSVLMLYSWTHCIILRLLSTLNTLLLQHNSYQFNISFYKLLEKKPIFPHCTSLRRQCHLNVYVYIRRKYNELSDVLECLDLSLSVISDSCSFNFFYIKYVPVYLNFEDNECTMTNVTEKHQ